ncbi:hypothetical protein HDU76_002050 [Blyttiomyces sp. JEL0837]|nr:hypothetical protein HDU76_002050 [Blyttiomyces sp. JEL0837]
MKLSTILITAALFMAQAAPGEAVAIRIRGAGAPQSQSGTHLSEIKSTHVETHMTTKTEIPKSYISTSHSSHAETHTTEVPKTRNSSTSKSSTTHLETHYTSARSSKPMETHSSTSKSTHKSEEPKTKVPTKTSTGHVETHPTSFAGHVETHASEVHSISPVTATKSHNETVHYSTMTTKTVPTPVANKCHDALAKLSYAEETVCHEFNVKYLARPRDNNGLPIVQFSADIIALNGRVNETCQTHGFTECRMARTNALNSCNPADWKMEKFPRERDSLVMAVQLSNILCVAAGEKCLGDFISSMPKLPLGEHFNNDTRNMWCHNQCLQNTFNLYLDTLGKLAYAHISSGPKILDAMKNMNNKICHSNSTVTVTHGDTSATHTESATDATTTSVLHMETHDGSVPVGRRQDMAEPGFFPDYTEPVRRDRNVGAVLVFS